MIPVQQQSGKVRGTEVLYFQDAELQKIKGNDTSYATTGTLSVLYFKEYDRFILALNDWKYPLLRRIPISASDKMNLCPRSYMLPAPNGFFFNLTLQNIGNQEALFNFESILSEDSNFSFKGESHPLRKISLSPNDKLHRTLKKDTGPMETISGGLKLAGQKIKNVIKSATTGTSALTSRKKPTNLKEIKNKNFRKNATSSFKKDFFECGQKLSQDFLKKRSENLNLIQSKDYKDMKKHLDQEPSMWFWKTEIEDTILTFKDIADKNYTNPDLMEKAKGSFDTLKQGLQRPLDGLKEGLREVKDSFTGNRMDDRSRATNTSMQDPNKIENARGFDAMAHSEG
jgi:hypothetical protein